MSSDPAGMRVALTPVEEAVVAGARRDARHALDDAEGAARRTLEQAQRQAQALLRGARAEGEAAARQAAALEVAAARREARQVVLQARRRVLDDLRHAALEELARRAGSPAAQRLAAELAQVVLARAGAGATVEHHGPGGLEVTASTATRRVELRLVDLLDDQLAAMADDVEELWG